MKRSAVRGMLRAWAVGALLPVALAGARASAPMPLTGARASAPVALTGASAAPVTLASLLREMADPDALTRLPQPRYTGRQVTSFDPAVTAQAGGGTPLNRGGYGGFLRTETKRGRTEWVILDQKGPGCITRLWTGVTRSRTKPVARFYLDGSSAPAMEAPLYDLLTGAAFVPYPYAFPTAPPEEVHALEPRYGAVLYLPVPFATGCRITLDAPPVYYEVEARAYGRGTAVETFSMRGLDAARPLLGSVGASLVHPPAPAGEAILRSAVLAPGARLAVPLPPGPGAVALLEVTVPHGSTPSVTAPTASPTMPALRALVLTGSFDTEATVWCPLSEFFGAGVRPASVADSNRSAAKDGVLTARWRMPYAISGQLALENHGTGSVPVSVRVVTVPRAWDARSMHFHASWRHAYPLKTTAAPAWSTLTASGTGLYVGDTLTVMNPTRFWFGQGAIRLFIDSADAPHDSVDTASYYGYAWESPNAFASPFVAMPVRDGAASGNSLGYTTMSRERRLDAVPFSDSLRCDAVLGHAAPAKADAAGGVAYAFAAFWYALPGATAGGPPPEQEAALALPEPPDLPELPEPPDRTAPFPNALEAEGWEVTEHSPGVQTNVYAFPPSTFGHWSAGAQRTVLPTRVGDSITFRVPARGTGKQHLVLHATKSWNFGTVRVAVNGRPVSPDFDLYSPQTRPSGPLDLGTCAPVDGAFSLTCTLTGWNPVALEPRMHFGLDCVTMTEAP